VSAGRRVTVVGGGVTGLSCALRLLEAGHEVTVVSDLPAGETTSSIAAAIWHPYLVSPADRVRGWAARTYDVLCSLAADGDAWGESAPAVRLMSGRELLAEPTPDPDWATAVPDLRRLEPAERPGRPDGWAFSTPLVDTPRYLDWLVDQVGAAGGRLERRRVASLAEESRRGDLVVNCTGLAARELVPDASVHAVRGQVVLVTNPGLSEWVLDDSDLGVMTYVIPRTDTVVCGGTAEPELEDRQPDLQLAAAILARARVLVPALRDAVVLGHRVGLRPARPEVRLDREESVEGPIVHCYGHGGAGVTLSWGCADEVVALVG